MHVLQFNIEPTPWARPTTAIINGFRRTLTTKKAREASETLKYLMRAKWRGQPLEAPLKLELVFSITKPKSCKRPFPSVKPDVDNFIKMVMDCGNEIIWKDDNLIVEISARKEYGEPGIRITVGEI